MSETTKEMTPSAAAASATVRASALIMAKGNPNQVVRVDERGRDTLDVAIAVYGVVTFSDGYEAWFRYTTAKLPSMVPIGPGAVIALFKAQRRQAGPLPFVCETTLGRRISAPARRAALLQHLRACAAHREAGGTPMGENHE